MRSHHLLHEVFVGMYVLLTLNPKTLNLKVRSGGTTQSRGHGHSSSGFRVYARTEVKTMDKRKGQWSLHEAYRYNILNYGPRFLAQV